MSTNKVQYRIPGPTWGYAGLTRAQKIAPYWLLRPLFMVGTWVALALMPEPRRNSRDF